MASLLIVLLFGIVHDLIVDTAESLLSWLIVANAAGLWIVNVHADAA